jgi:hypothetical protein
MTAGKPNTEYRVTLCKKEEGKLPVMTPYKIGKKQYEKILLLILKAQGKVDWQR